MPSGICLRLDETNGKAWSYGWRKECLLIIMVSSALKEDPDPRLTAYLCINLGLIMV